MHKRSKKSNQHSFLLERLQQGSRGTRIEKDCPHFLALHLKVKHSKLHVRLNYVVLLRFPKIKKKNLQDSDLLCTTNPWNWREVEKTLYY